MIYRDFHIEENWLGLWEWTHKDYDLDDPRHGSEATFEAAKIAVDEWHDENN